MYDIYPNWPKQHLVNALCTTRALGSSTGSFSSNNLALHVEDNFENVVQNRKALKSRLKLPSEPIWLEQTHSTEVIVAEEDANRRADAAITRSKDTVLAIMTADCLPILCFDKEGGEIAAIHAGWRGLAAGIIDKTFSRMLAKPENLCFWIGPAICQSCFEVGEEVLDMFVETYPFSNKFFLKTDNTWYANLPQLAIEISKHLGVNSCFSSNLCTFERKSEFFSYRRDKQTGRMVSLIWFNKSRII